MFLFGGEIKGNSESNFRLETARHEADGMRSMQDRVTRGKQATFSQALHGRAQEAGAPTGKNPDRVSGLFHSLGIFR